MKFGIIGAGIVGTALALRLEEVGYECLGVHTRSPQSYERFRRYVNKEHLSLEKLSSDADVLFITTQDSMIRSAAEQLSQNTRVKSGQVWIHCSGSLPSQVLKVIEDLPVRYLSVHPLQAFASIENALQILPGTHYGIEGEEEALGERLVRDLGGIPHRILSHQKSLYHAGAVVASNYLVVLASLAVDLFAEAGFNREDALASLLPLMQGTLYNLEQVGLPQALTGPIARGDVHVVKGHLEHMPINLADIYRVLGLKALALGETKKEQQGLTYAAETINALKECLEDRKKD